MATHDQETAAFFKGSEVHCVLCPRQGGTEDSYLQVSSWACRWCAQEVSLHLKEHITPASPPHLTHYAHIAPATQSAVRGNCFSHHQKTVIVDAPLDHPLASTADAAAGGQPPGSTPVAPAPAAPAAPAPLSRMASLMLQRSKSNAVHARAEVPTRRLLAFVGGLDLTNGRYDTHDHPLFATQQEGGPHEHDCYQACIDGAIGLVGAFREAGCDTRAGSLTPVCPAAAAAARSGLNTNNDHPRQVGGSSHVCTLGAALCPHIQQPCCHCIQQPHN
jgi:hypothetical protein